MTEKGPDKFYTPSDATFYDLFMLKFKTIIDFVNPMKEKFGAEEVNEIVKKVGEDDGIKIAEQVKTQMPINSIEDVKNFYIGFMNSKPMQAALTYEILEETDKNLKFNVTECLYAKGFKDLNETELGYCAVCHADYALVKALNPKLKLTRTKTLMQDEDCCDFHFTLEE